MQKNLRLIARLIVARHECTYVRHCKENAPIYMYYIAPETPMMSSVIADCPNLAPPQYFGQVYAYATCIRTSRSVRDTGIVCSVEMMMNQLVGQRWEPVTSGKDILSW